MASETLQSPSPTHILRQSHCFSTQQACFYFTPPALTVPLAYKGLVASVSLSLGLWCRYFKITFPQPHHFHSPSICSYSGLTGIQLHTGNMKAIRGHKLLSVLYFQYLKQGCAHNKNMKISAKGTSKLVCYMIKASYKTT